MIQCILDCYSTELKKYENKNIPKTTSLKQMLTVLWKGRNFFSKFFLCSYTSAPVTEKSSLRVSNLLQVYFSDTLLTLLDVPIRTDILKEIVNYE